MTVKAGEWGTLSRLLDEALDLEPAQRSSWIASLAPEHESLKATLRDLLLGPSGIETADLLNRIPDLVNEGSQESFAAGELVGPYRLIRELGTGGMASVWLAERADGSLQRRVALKIPRLAWIDRGLVSRMMRERDILSALEHPHIARLYDAGADAQGRPYLALEYVEGVPLNTYSSDRALTLRQRLELFLKIARAVAFAHARLIVHRDLKPTNILVKQDGDVRLLDFGIARLLQSESEQGAHHTQFGSRALTPRYAAPEQFTHQPITVATDVYSLGVLLYELLTDASPYTPKRESHIALEDCVLNDQPPLPSTAKSPLARALRGDLDGILLKALRKSPADRYASVETFAADIERYLNGQPVDARPASKLYQLGKFVSRHKLQVGAATAVVLALTVGLGATLWQARVAATERDHAFMLASRNAAISEFMEMLITEAAMSAKPVTVSDMLTRSEKLALADTASSQENRAAILGMIASRYYMAGDNGESKKLLESALALVRNSQDVELRASLICRRAMTVADLGQTSEAARAIIDELKRLQSNTEVASDCLQYRAHIAVLEGDAAGAMRYATLALEHHRKAPHTSVSSEAYLLAAVATGHELNGRNGEAEEYFRQALEKLAEAGREQNLGASQIRNNWANLSIRAGTPRRAFELYDQTLRLVMSQNPDSGSSVVLLYNRAHALELIGRFREASVAYEQGRQLSDRSKNLFGQVFCTLGLTSVALESGDLGTASLFIQRATELAGSSLRAESPVMRRLASVQGQVFLAKGEIDAARGRFERKDNTKETKGPADIEAELGAAEVELRGVDAPAAIGHARAALEMSTSLQGGVPYSNFTGLSWLMLGRVLQARGEIAEARKAFEAAVTHLSNTVDADHPELLRARELLAATNQRLTR